MSESSTLLKRACVALEKSAFPTFRRNEDHHGRNALMGAAAVSPFAGLIGQQKMLHQGKGKEVGSFKELKRLARPGDIIITGGTNGDPAKFLISAATGTPKGYHAAIFNGSGISESHPAYGFADMPFEAAQEHLQILRPDLPEAERKQFVKRVSDYTDTAYGFEDATRKVLRSRGLSNNTAVDLAETARAGMYDRRGSILAGLKELFVPKLRSAAAIEADRKRQLELRKAFKQTGMPEAATRAADRIDSITSSPSWLRRSLRHVHPRFENLVQDFDFEGVVPDCVGGTCSSVPASLLPEGAAVVPGKLPKDILPSDFLRSKMFKPIARYSPSGVTSPIQDFALKHAPLAIRAGVGLGLAGGVYGASKLLDKYNDKKASHELDLLSRAYANLGPHTQR